MSGDEKVNFRIKRKLKNWFKKYASSKGGMSKVLQDHIAALQQEEEEKRKCPTTRP